jgi:hypothetical protein
LSCSLEERENIINNYSLEDFKMAEVEEKDNLWLIVGVCIAAIVVLVVMLKADETKHLQSGAVAESQKEVFTKIEKRHTSNNSSAEQISGK